MEYKNKELLREQSYLISRGVRPMSLIGTCPSDPNSRLEMLAILEECRTLPSIPFVIDKGEGAAEFGYASHQWVIDLFGLFAKAYSPVP